VNYRKRKKEVKETLFSTDDASVKEIQY